jgi:hypothetical protein
MTVMACYDFQRETPRKAEAFSGVIDDEFSTRFRIKRVNRVNQRRAYGLRDEESSRMKVLLHPSRDLKWSQTTRSITR